MRYELPAINFHLRARCAREREGRGQMRHPRARGTIRSICDSPALRGGVGWRSRDQPAARVDSISPRQALEEAQRLAAGAGVEACLVPARRNVDDVH
jgi:hypothetical protein